MSRYAHCCTLTHSWISPLGGPRYVLPKTRLSRNLQVYRGTELHDFAYMKTSGVVFFVYEGLDSSKTKEIVCVI